MPSDTEKVWKANQAKVAWAKKFPGRIRSWDEVEGKRVRKVFNLPGRSAAVLVLSDRSFAIVPQLEVDTGHLVAALLAARSELKFRHRETFQKLDSLVAREKELLRQARLQKILGAVQNNMPDIPELKTELLRLLSRY